MSNETEGYWKVNREKKKEITRRTIMEEGFKLYAEHGIEPVTLPEVADASIVGRATIFRYFNNKLEFVIAMAAWKWEEYIKEHDESIDKDVVQRMTGAEYLKFYLDAFLDLYRNHADLLRFNYNFNNFVRNEKCTPEQMQPYLQVVDKLGEGFHDLYERGIKDGTLSPEVPEKEMFSTTFHIMLAAVTRYAIGLVYVYETADPEKELIRLEKMLLREFTREA